MTSAAPVGLRFIGFVESSLRQAAEAPRQPDEGAPAAWLVIEPAFQDGLLDLEVGAAVVVLTWLHQADRAVLRVHPRGDPTRPEQGVFSTRSPHRPNPIGLHEVTIRAVDGVRLLVNEMEAIDGTPILDIKPALVRVEDR